MNNAVKLLGIARTFVWLAAIWMAGFLTLVLTHHDDWAFLLLYGTGCVLLLIA